MIACVFHVCGYRSRKQTQGFKLVAAHYHFQFDFSSCVHNWRYPKSPIFSGRVGRKRSLFFDAESKTGETPTFHIFREGDLFLIPSLNLVKSRSPILSGPVEVSLSKTGEIPKYHIFEKEGVDIPSFVPKSNDLDTSVATFAISRPLCFKHKWSLSHDNILSMHWRNPMNRSIDRYSKSIV